MYAKTLRNTVVGVRTLVAISVLFTSLYSSGAVPKISGTVTDFDGKPIANLTVVIKNKVTHHSLSVKTDEHGRFCVRNLKGSDYSVLVVADSGQDGFSLQLDHAGSENTGKKGDHKTAAQ